MSPLFPPNFSSSRNKSLRILLDVVSATFVEYTVRHMFDVDAGVVDSAPSDTAPEASGVIPCVAEA